ncbi:MAG: hypothetical protein LC794_19845 [Acidobacteria bacterium]|nr:hypothetical protein [Acidobacteriota bacterium]
MSARALRRFVAGARQRAVVARLDHPGNAMNTVKHGWIADGIPFAKGSVTRMEVLP